MNDVWLFGQAWIVPRTRDVLWATIGGLPPGFAASGGGRAADKYGAASQGASAFAVSDSMQ